VYTRLLFE